MAYAVRLTAPLGLALAGLLGLALARLIEPSRDTAELIALALVFACVAPAAVHDIRSWRRRFP